LLKSDAILFFEQQAPRDGAASGWGVGRVLIKRARPGWMIRQTGGYCDCAKNNSKQYVCMHAQYQLEPAGWNATDMSTSPVEHRSTI
jgi:hypothetical protein